MSRSRGAEKNQKREKKHFPLLKFKHLPRFHPSSLEITKVVKAGIKQQAFLNPQRVMQVNVFKAAGNKRQNNNGNTCREFVASPT